MEKPLAGLKCLVCGMDKAAPVEATIIKLGGEIFIFTPRNTHEFPDVVVSESACAKRLQVNIAIAHVDHR